MNFWLQGLLVLVAVAGADVAWTRYTLAVTARAAHRAGVWSVVIILLGVVSVISYTHDWRMVGFAAVGAYAGTWWAVRVHK